MRLPWTVFLAPSPPALIFAAKTLFAAGVALWLALRFSLEQPVWAGMTVFIVSQPLSGMVMSKGLFRLLGTLVGTTMSVVLMGAFAQMPWLFLLGLASWLGLCTAASTLLRNHVAYGFVLAGYTAAIIGLPAIAHPLQVFDQAVARCTEISLGIVVASMVSALIWPQRVERTLGTQARNTWAQGVAAARAEIVQAEDATQGLLKALGLVVAVDAQRDHAWFEGQQGRQRARALRVLARDLLSLLRTARGAMRQWRNLPEARLTPLEPFRQRLLEVLDDPQPLTVEALLHDLREAAGDAALDNDQRYLLARFGILLDKVLVAGRALSDVHSGRLAAVAPSALAHHRDVQTALLYGLRSAGALLGVGMFWLGTAWPSAPGAMLMTGVICSLFANRDNAAAVGLGFLRGILYAVPVAIVVTQMLLPQASGYPILCLVLGVPLFFAVLGMAGPPVYIGTCTAFAMNLLVLVAPNNHAQTEMAALLNQAQSLLLGVGFAVVMFRLITLRMPRRTSRRILVATTYDLRRLASVPLRNAETWFGGRMADRLLLLARHIEALPEGERERWELGLLALDLGNELLHLRACLEGAQGDVRVARDAFLRTFADCLAMGIDQLRPEQLDDAAEHLREALREAPDDEPHRLARGAVGHLLRTWRSCCQKDTTLHEPA